MRYMRKEYHHNTRWLARCYEARKMKKNTWRRTATTPNKLQFLLWIRIRVESSRVVFSFLSIPFSPFGTISNTLSMHKLCTSKANTQHVTCYMYTIKSWRVINRMEFNGPRLARSFFRESTQLLGTLSAFDHAFNLLKLQLKLEKISSEMISLFFACAHLRPMPIFSLYSIYIFQFAKCNFIYFFSFYFFFIIFFFFSFFYSCMILIQFIAYLKTHKN